ncbi:MAG: CPBP family intramembrane metalloprotease [Anaerolineales bacterium]|nr:CPBP family intramembrane metalloprotease [Anaerolineales bacterium]
MNKKTPQSNPELENTFSHPRVLRDILIVASPIVVLGIVGNAIGLSTLAGGAIINLGYVLAIIFGGIILKRQGSGWRKIGLEKPASWLKTMFLGVGAWIGAVVVFVATQMIAVGFLTALGMAPSEIDQSRFNPIVDNLPLFILMVILSWTTIAFGEELFYRAFLITRLIDYTAIGKGLAIVIGGIIFGAVHFAEGPVGILSNGAFGILFGWIYVRSGRNLWITIIGHGLINTLRFVLLYIGAA